MPLEVLVVGAGIVGLAAARALARRGHAVIVAEATGGIGSGVSSRNSEVIHAGLYYPAGSLRAQHCIAGRLALIEFCQTRGIPYRLCGKLVAATTDGEIPAVEAIARRGSGNGAESLRMLDQAEAQALEPALACRAALLSPGTGIVDSHGVMLALQGEIEDHGGAVALHAPVEALTPRGAGWTARVGGAEPMALEIDAVVNAAGLAAQAVARRTEGFPTERIPRQVLAKGNYFALRGRAPFDRLVYPAPVEGGLGIHATLDLAGRMRFGPDVEWVESEDYAVDPGRAGAFGASIRRYWPACRDEDLVPDYAGLRPKLSGPGEPAADFLMDGPAEHGRPGLVHLFGIESPGLTSSLSLAEAVADALDA